MLVKRAPGTFYNNKRPSFENENTGGSVLKRAMNTICAKNRNLSQKIYKPQPTMRRLNKFNNTKFGNRNNGGNSQGGYYNTSFNNKNLNKTDGLVYQQQHFHNNKQEIRVYNRF